MLLQECDEAGVQIVTDCGVGAVAADGHFIVDAGQGRFSCESLVVATGGLSIPKMGASGIGYELARQFGLRVYDTRAALVPFTFTGSLHTLTERLAGVSTAATVRVNGVAFTEDILFTHRGLSGPAVLQLSSYWRPGDAIRVDLLPGRDAGAMSLAWKRQHPRALLRSQLGPLLPGQLPRELERLFWPDAAERPLADWPDRDLARVAARLNGWELRPAATEGYRTAEVTLGGVDTRDLSSRTMESIVPGLFFIGEVVDVTGHLGGFNFQWAWSSGHAAGLAV